MKVESIYKSQSWHYELVQFLAERLQVPIIEESSSSNISVLQKEKPKIESYDSRQNLPTRDQKDLTI